MMTATVGRPDHDGEGAPALDPDQRGGGGWRGLPGWARSLLVASCCFALIGAGVAIVAATRDGDPLDGVVELSGDGPEPFIDETTGAVTFVIPAGTAQRQAAGEQVVVLPTRVGIKVDQRLSLRNDDDKAVVIGPFFVAPRETSTYRFSSPRVIVGACDLHPSGEFTVEVTA